MADFRIWGTINQVAPEQFIVTISAVPDDTPLLAGGVHVETREAKSRELAVEACADMVLVMGQRIRERGDRVIDVEAQ